MVKYNICMFACNEEENIRQSIGSVREQCSEQLNRFYVIANGCSDNTAEVAKAIGADGFEKLEVIEIALGDKCNAWNHYMHQVPGGADVHFFVDADVYFSENCFDKMAEKLTHMPEETVAVAGMPLSGRNREFYASLVTERSCFFGNLYGLKVSFIERVRALPFHLPVGLNWIDSFLTKAVNTDLSFSTTNLPNRVCYVEGVGYRFDKLSPLSWSAIKLYINRIARYELGKIQEKYLDEIPVEQWPLQMTEINEQIFKNFKADSKGLSFLMRRLVFKRLCKLLKASKR